MLFLQKIFAFVSKLKHDSLSEEIVLSSSFPGLNPDSSAIFYPWPFPHVVIDNAFTIEVADSMSTHIDNLLKNRNENFIYRDFYELSLRSVIFGETQALDTFFSIKYKAFVQSLFPIRLSNHTTITIHNNTPRVGDKYIHSDWVLAYFYGGEKTDRLTNPNPPELERNVVKEGERPPTNTTVERRVITGIAYLSKDWKHGDGGATGIFSKVGNELVSAGEVEPRYNRLLFFLNSPTSFHNYTASSLPNRNSIIQWFHSRPAGR